MTPGSSFVVRQPAVVALIEDRDDEDGERGRDHCPKDKRDGKAAKDRVGHHDCRAEDDGEGGEQDRA